MPSTEFSTAVRPRSVPSVWPISLIAFQLNLRSGAVGGAGGIARLNSQPTMASPITQTDTQRSACSSCISGPPARKPSRIAMKVAASTQALPPTSSQGFRCCGISEYLSGPKKADCVPIRNSTPSRNSTEPSAKPSAAAPMIRISANLIRRISRAFSYFSAIWPALAENRKKGRMNSAAAMFEYSRLCSWSVPTR